MNASSARTRKKRSFWPPLWMRLILLLPLALMLWLRLSDSSGDEGITNVNTFMLGALCLLIVLPWFMFFSAYSSSWRFGLPLASVVAAVVFFSVFQYQGVSGNMIPRFAMAAAGEDDAVEPAAGVVPATPVDLQTTTSMDFPGYLGPERSASVSGVRLDPDWETHPPEEVWRHPVGAGWSAFSVVNGVAVTMEQMGEKEAITAYDARTGALLWVNQAEGRYAHVLGGVGPRSTPTIAAGFVYALGAQGRLVCLNGGDGRVVWEKNLLTEFEVTPEQEFANIQFGRSNSPLILDEMLIIPAGGNKGRRLASLAAYRMDTGTLVWEAGERQISFASAQVATLAGVRQILIVNEDTLSGHDPGSGAVLWEHPWPGNTSSNASSSQAVPVFPDKVFVSKGYGGGAALLRLIPGADGTLQVEEEWADSRVMRTKFTQVVIRDGYVYGLSDGILECIRLSDGKRMWKGGRYQHGQILGVGEHLLVLTEDGEVVLVKASPEEGNRVLGRFQSVMGPTWNNLALYGDLLLVRNSREAAAWRLPLLDGAEPLP